MGNAFPNLKWKRRSKQLDIIRRAVEGISMREEVEAELIEQMLISRVARYEFLARRWRAASCITRALMGKKIMRELRQMRMEGLACLRACLQRLTFPDYERNLYYARNNTVDALDVGVIRINFRFRCKAHLHELVDRLPLICLSTKLKQVSLHQVVYVPVVGFQVHIFFFLR